jgi:hypothetical protein
MDKCTTPAWFVMSSVSLTATKRCPGRWEETDQGKSSLRNRALSVDGAKILVMRLRQIGRVARQSKWIYGNGRSFPNGWFNPPTGDYKSDCEYREPDAEQSAHVRSPVALRKRAFALELPSH